ITVIGVKVVGVVLMVAVVIAPAVAARQWTNRLIPFIACSGAIGGLSAVLGAYFSIAAGETAVGSIPTGPAIALVQGLIAAASLTAQKVRSTPVFSSSLLPISYYHSTGLLDSRSLRGYEARQHAYRWNRPRCLTRHRRLISLYLRYRFPLAAIDCRTRWSRRCPGHRLVGTKRNHH